jgi:4-hydroxy-2-oxoglutarate aldolase
LETHDQTSGRTAPTARTAGEKLRGILLPFPTPFGEDGEVDARAVRSNIRRWNETGVSGYVALGSTGERAHLDERERAAVVEAARGEIPAGLAFVVGAGEQSTRATVAEARRVAAQGADALLVITPHFYRAAMTAEALFRHFSEVADASPVPVVLYSIPQNAGGLGVAPELAARLAAHGNVVGIKDSSGDLLNLAETLRLAGDRDDFAVTVGHAGALYAALASGARGAILAAACAVPELCVEIHARVAAGDHARALALQKLLTPFARAVTTGHGIGGLKAALDLRGYTGGPVRAPLRAPDEDARREIARLLQESKDGGQRVAGGEQ